jgi:hypothetical protein
MSEYSIYPKAIDGYAQIPLAVDKRSPVNAQSVNRLRSGIINIEKAIGIAPGYSSRFGDFSDLAERIESLEDFSIETREGMPTEVSSQLEERLAGLGLEGLVESFTEDLTLSDLYSNSGYIQLEEHPLSLVNSNDTAFLDFFYNNGQKSFVIGSSEGITLKSSGTMPVESDIGMPLELFPKSVVIEGSDQVSMVDEGEAALLTSYLSFGGEFEHSDLVISKSEKEGGEDKSVSILAGLGSFSGSSSEAVSLEVQAFPATLASIGAPNVSISAGASMLEGNTAGSVRLAGGYSITGAQGASVSIGGGGSDNPETAGQLRLRSGHGGPDTLAGDVIVETGINGSGSGAGSIDILAGPRSSPILGAINMRGSVAIENNISLPIRKHVTSNDGPNCIVSDNDYTLLIDATFGDTAVHLPHPSGCPGRVCVVKKIDDVHAVTIWNTGGMIEGSPSALLYSQYESMMFQSDGIAHWWKLN